MTFSGERIETGKIISSEFTGQRQKSVLRLEQKFPCRDNLDFYPFFFYLAFVIVCDYYITTT